MPTKRAWFLLSLAFGLYLLANQTQVGWVYVMVNGLVGLLGVAFFYSLGTLSGIRIRRSFDNLSASPATPQDKVRRPVDDIANDDDLFRPTDFYEDDLAEVTLHFQQTGLKPVFLVGGQEWCPFAAPEEREQPFFIPRLFKGDPVRLTYQVGCHRRGYYSFSQMQIRSSGPFGLFRSKRTLAAPSDLLIYPQYQPLKRLRLLENRGFTEKQALRVGASNEVIGAREYRPGDPMRHIHWRSTARLGRFITKELSDNDQLTMSVVLDLSVGGSIGAGKFSTFETAIRIAASLGYYATHQAVPFYLVGQSRRWQPPATALSWWSILNYLAKVENDGQVALADVVRTLPAVPFVVVLISNPDEATGQALMALRQRGARILAMFIAPDENSPLESIPLPNREGLESRLVTPHSWKAVLDEL